MTTSTAETPQAAHDPTPEEKLRAMVEAFKTTLTRHGGGNEDAAKNFEAMLDRSPYLKALMVQAVRDGQLAGFEINHNGFSGGNYDPNDRVLRMNYGELAIGHQDPQWMGQNIYLAAHETRHALEPAADKRQFLEFEAAASKEMHRFVIPGNGQAPGAVSQPPHDYTRALSGYVEASRRSEAVAEIAGFNAVVSMIRAEGRTPDLATIHEAAPERTGEYIHRSGEAPNYRYALQPGVVLNADFTMPENAANRRAVGREYFNDPASDTMFGARKDQDYTNHVAVRALQHIISIEAQLPELYASYGMRPSQVHINMKAIGLDEKQLEPYLKLPGGKPFVYYDTSTGVPVKKTFDPVVDNIQDKQEQPARSTAPGKVEPGKTGKPGKGPDADGYGADGVGALEPLERLGGRRRTDFDTIAATVSRDGRWDGEATRNIAAALLREVDRDPSVRQVDHVLVSDQGSGGPRVFAMYTPNQDREPYFHASVDATVAARQPLTQNLDAVIARQAAAEGVQPQQQDNAEASRGPRLA
ncbi:XVIPCD domain-containing protein [Lysobacter hankyongensis]|uniref:Peptidoglycan-binding protein n=1 Tax=Lysobacter hankyongensis TaxID=1176535 RepID=A0ABP9AGU7_9GAMM